MKRTRLTLMLMGVAVAISLLISACGGDAPAANQGSSTPTTAAGNTPTATTAANGQLACEKGTLQIDGSSALEPLISAVKKDYEAKCSGSSITVTPNGSGTGLKDAAAGSVNIGMSDVFPKTDEQKKVLVDHQVAVVIFSLVINKQITGVTSLTADQIKKIYSGAVTNWKDVGGNDLKIVVVERPSGSGTRATFEKYVLEGKETVKGDSKLQTDTTGTVIQNVKSNAGAIGYVTLGAAKANTDVSIIGIDGKNPSKETVIDKTYKFWNIEHLFTKGEATGLTKSFIDYVSSADAKQHAEDLGYVLLNEVPKELLDPRQPKP